MFIKLIRNSKVSLTRQIYLSIKNKILDGELNEHEKLRSTRELASDLSVSRTIILDAYEQLLAEGYIYSREGSGSYVSEGIKFSKPKMEFEEKEENDELKYPEKYKSFGFRTGVPDLNRVPVNLWGKMYKNVVNTIDSNGLDYHNPMGDFGLRNEISKYLRRIRGVEASPNQILITNGAAQGFSLLKAILDHSDYMLVENPINQGILKTLEGNGICYKAIDIDEKGMITKELPEKPPKLILTTPSHQFPTGVVMTIKRRIELLKYAEKHDVYIVEDDYDSEYRYEGDPIQSLQSVNPKRVIYIGSFSKTFCPAIRLGYMIIPKPLIEAVKDAKYVSDLHSPILEQMTMASFIKSGQFEKHIRRMKKIYHKRRNCVIEALKKYFGDGVEIYGENAGLHLVAGFKSIEFDDLLIENLKNKHIHVLPLSAYYITIDEGKRNNLLVIGFGNMEEADIFEGIKIIYDTLLENGRVF